MDGGSAGFAGAKTGLMYYVYTALPQLLSPCLSGARYALQRYKKNRPLGRFFCGCDLREGGDL